MNKSSEFFKSAGKKGFILIPRCLMEECFGERKGTGMNQFEAYVYLLLHGCYKDQEGAGGLKRGELRFSIRRLAAALGWNGSRVVRFLNALKRLEVITVQRTPMGSVMRLLYYEEMCLYRNGAGGKSPQTKGASSRIGVEPPTAAGEELFEAFWSSYADVTGRTYPDKEETRRIWYTLTEAERSLALDRVWDYAQCVGDVRWMRSPLNYLQKKSFMSIK